MNVGIEISLITGFNVGFEWHETGKIEEDIGYWVFDLGIFRILVAYQ